MGTYFLQVSLFWLGAWGFYQLSLRRETFFHLNRAYLLATLLLGLLLPFVPWPSLGATPAWTGTPVVWLQTITIRAAPPADAAAATPVWLTWLWRAYLLGSALAALRLAVNLWRMRQRLRHGRLEHSDGFTWVHSEEPHLPYSWFGYLFWSDSLRLTAEESRQIIAHERAHMRLGHSWDVLAYELIGLACWWHPLWIAYGRSLRNVHEY
ncbi:MAG: hypothetical protein KDC54_24635, partial [Lewinella sp.]|nr:hypothetical protein [Lewinella sp.]